MLREISGYEDDEEEMYTLNTNPDAHAINIVEHSMNHNDESSSSFLNSGS